MSVTVRAGASAEELYALVSDVERMGEWSPENVGGRWLGGATGPAVGARFSGANRRGWRRWSTTCTVTAAEAGRKFAFDVAFTAIPVSRWTYEFHPDGDATVVTESWTDRRPAWFVLMTKPTMGVGDVRAHNEDNIRKTLANLAAAAERRS
ncbi:MAG TPA: SRPBCC family protein [Acidimicrobiales bacterium]|nr:SRPBCC family protein [Acidimicrobiales bacterium]